MNKNCRQRGSFSCVKELIAKIEQYVAINNKTKAPFNWTGGVGGFNSGKAPATLFASLQHTTLARGFRFDQGYF